MRWTRSIFATLFAVFFLGSALKAQGPVRTPEPASGPGAPPIFLNMVHETLIPGKDSAYEAEEANIVRGYARANIPVYWIAWESITGAPEILYLNLFDSFEQAENTGVALDSAMAAHPDLAQTQDRLLQNNVRDVQTVFTLRRDDLSYRFNLIDFAKARLLRVTTIVVRPGHEAELIEIGRNIVSVTEKARTDTAWAVYEVNAGAPTPTFVYLTPMVSMKEMDAALTRRNLYEDTRGSGLQQRLQEVARSAYISNESQIYFLSREMSHVSKEFAGGDPDFWNGRMQSQNTEALKFNLSQPNGSAKQR